MLDVTVRLEELKASPYLEEEIVAPHTGTVEFLETLQPGLKVRGPSGSWKEKPGTTLAVLTRERNPKPIRASQNAEVMRVNTDAAGKFVEAGTPLVTVRHFLSKREVLDIILKEALHLFRAPERGKYYFVPQVDKKISASGSRSVKVQDGMELFILSRMKRETAIHYEGPAGLIYAVYFQYNENVDAGAPLVGVCTSEQLPMIEDVVVRVQNEWVERD